MKKTAKQTDRRARLLIVLGIVVYIALYHWVYVSWLSPVWSYFGFSYNAPPIGYFVLACALAILPAWWMPVVATRPSQLIYWVLYITVYIPSLFVPLYMAVVPLYEVAELMGVLFVGLAIMGASYTRPLLRINPRPVSKSFFWYGVGGILVVLTLWVVFVYFGHFELVGFDRIYDQIRSSGGALAEGTGAQYAIMWLSGAFFPFLMVWGITKKKFWFFVAGAGGQVMLYATAGLKAILLSTVFIPLMYICLRGAKAKFGVRLIWGVVLLFISLYSVTLLMARVEDPGVVDTAASLVFVRTFGIPGLATGHYQRFFSDHPYTYYSHVKGVNLLVEYPYQQEISREVGYYFYFNEANWNANMWATDGLAAGGLIGILIISLICGFVFWVLDSAAANHNPKFAVLLTCFAACNIGNTSLFTSLLSGGLGFLIVLLFIMPRDEQPEESSTGKQTLAYPGLNARPLGMGNRDAIGSQALNASLLRSKSYGGV